MTLLKLWFEIVFVNTGVYTISDSGLNMELMNSRIAFGSKVELCSEN